MIVSRYRFDEPICGCEGGITTCAFISPVSNINEQTAVQATNRIIRVTFLLVQKLEVVLELRSKVSLGFSFAARHGFSCLPRERRCILL